MRPLPRRWGAGTGSTDGARLLGVSGSPRGGRQPPSSISRGAIVWRARGTRDPVLLETAEGRSSIAATQHGTSHVGDCQLFGATGAGGSQVWPAATGGLGIRKAFHRGTGVHRAAWHAGSRSMSLRWSPQARGAGWGRPVQPCGVPGDKLKSLAQRPAPASGLQTSNQAALPSENGFIGPKRPTRQCNYSPFHQQCHKSDRLAANKRQ